MNRFLTLLLSWWVSQTSAYYFDRFINTQAFAPPPYSGLNNTSLFGFSLAFFANENSKSLIIGAPKADVIGKLFSCSVSDIANSRCEEWYISEDIRIQKVRTDNFTFVKKQDRTDAWLGATVSAGPSYVIACAPRVMNWVPTTKNTHLGTFGQCYVNDAAQKNIMQNFPIMAMGDNRFNIIASSHWLNSFGWSSAVGNGGAIVGGPATHRTGAWVFEEVLTKMEKSMPIPIYSRAHFKDPMIYNLGYSVAIGNFFNETESIYALGSPFGEYGVGKVVFFKRNSSAVFKINQVNSDFFNLEMNCDLNDPGVPGSMFAAVMCTANLDEDGRTDLLVGAPTFSDEEPSLFETGAVYVFYGMSCSSSAEMRKPRVIKGTQTGGRFGMAISNIGDMDNDHLDDIVIAAPYEDSGRGAIYLFPGATFQGTKQSVFSQKIQPEDTSSFRNFGFSLAALLEYDDIGSSGLAVGGGPGNEGVAFLHYIPTYQVEIYAIVPDLQAHNALMFTMSSCFNFTYPSKPTILSAHIEMTVEILHKYAKLAGNQSLFQSKFHINKTILNRCETVEVEMPANGNYVEDPIQYVIRARDAEDPLNYNASDARLLKRPANRYQRVLWKLECIDAKCRPDLTPSIQSAMSTPYLVGSTSAEVLELTVANGKEDPAREHCARLCVRSGTATLRPTTTCNLDKECLLCRPRRLLTKDNPWVISDLKLSTASLTSDDVEVNITATVYNYCTDEDAGKREVEFRRRLLYDPENISLNGANEAGLDIIKVNETELNYGGRRFTHKYALINNGKTTWSSLQSEVELEPRPYLSYDIKISKAEVQWSCEIGQHVNKTKKYNATCDLGRLRPGQKTDIHITIWVKNFNKGLFDKNVTVTSGIAIGKIDKFKGIETLLVLVKTKVEMWIIVVSCLSGILLLILIAYTLYKCGFLKRKKKEELTTLIRRESIRRQSMRQSVLENRLSQRMSALSKRNSMYGSLPDQELEHAQRLSREGRNDPAFGEPPEYRRNTSKTDRAVSKGSSNHGSSTQTTEAEIHI